MNKLSEYIKKRRCDRLDEWSMDCLAKDVEKLEQSIPISKLEELIEKSFFTVDVAEDETDTVVSVDDLRHFIIDCTILRKAKGNE